MSTVPCDCPEFQHWHNEGCQHYESCGGQTFDPPCGGCDLCMRMQDEYYRYLARNEKGKEER